MKAYVFSIGEPTLALCEWSLKRMGLEVTICHNPSTSLWQKLEWLYNNADEDFIRVDADVIVNANIMKLEPKDNCWWHQCYGWDWYHQDLRPLSVNYIKKEALPYLREKIYEFENAERPETQMFRLDEFHNPRRCEVYNIVCGIHGYGQRDLERIIDTKQRRNQNYDWELVRAIGTFR